jgi:hypothetical protein
MAAYRSGTIVAVIGPHGPIRGPIASHSAALLPRISQVCFSEGINGYNTVQKQPVSISNNFMTMIDIKNLAK